MKVFMLVMSLFVSRILLAASSLIGFFVFDYDSIWRYEAASGRQVSSEE